MTAISACILSVSGPSLTRDEARLLAGAQPFGVILMGRSCVSRGQVSRLTADIRETCGRDLLIFVDQEGGRVRRLRPPEWPDFPAAAVYGAVHERDAQAGLEAVRLGHHLMAAELSAIGINADCAPVVDLLHSGAHQIVGDRAFGPDPEKVGALARAALEGLAAGGVAGVIKHIPGHGRAAADSHEKLPVVNADRSELEKDFAAFRSVRDAPMAMTAHIAYPQLDGDCAATVSDRILTQIVRGEIGFDGLLMTDDLGMNALGGSLGNRARRAFAAGCDVALHCSGFVKEPVAILAEMTEVAESSPALAGASLSRAQTAQAAAGRSQPIDIAEARGRLDRLLALAGHAAA